MRLSFSWGARLLLAFGVAVAPVSCDSGEAVQGKGGKPTPQPKPWITVSKETTFITEPLTKNGYVDYMAALNAIRSKGVSPQNNAAVRLYQGFGPKIIPENRRESVAAMLGVAPLPDAGKYFEQFDAFAARKLPKEASPPPPAGKKDAVEAAKEQFEKTSRRRWSKNEFPLVAAWLAENEKSLELFVDASKRPRFFFPLFVSSNSPMVLDSQLPMAQQARGAARALSARAMLRVKMGRNDEAWQDLLACHRLARFIGQGPTIVEGLVGYAIERETYKADAALGHYGNLSAVQAKRFADELKRLPGSARMADKFDVGERFTYLDAVSTVAQRMTGQLPRRARGSADKNPLGALLVILASRTMIDWDESMRMGNAWFDRLSTAFAQPTRAERDALLDEIDHDLKQAAVQMKDSKAVLRELWSASPRRAAGRQLGRRFVAELVPPVPMAVQAEDCAVAYSAMSQVVFALTAYRADRGEYPKEVGDICPQYLAAIPEDPLSTGPLRYKRTDAGYVVYSVGIKQKRDGGATDPLTDDAPVSAETAAIAIVVPWPEDK
jgi:hypothetical protein